MREKCITGFFYYFCMPLMVSTFFTLYVWPHFGSTLDFDFYASATGSDSIDLENLFNQRTEVVRVIAYWLLYVTGSDTFLFNALGVVNSFLIYRLLIFFRGRIDGWLFVVLVLATYSPSFMVYRTIFGKDAIAISSFLLAILAFTWLSKRGIGAIFSITVIFTAVFLGLLVRPIFGIFYFLVLSGLIVITGRGLLVLVARKFSSALVTFIALALTLTSMLLGYVLSGEALAMFHEYYGADGQFTSRDHLFADEFGSVLLTYMAVSFWGFSVGPLPAELFLRPVFLAYTVAHLLFNLAYFNGIFAYLSNSCASGRFTCKTAFVFTLIVLLPIYCFLPIALAPLIAHHISFTERYMVSFTPFIYISAILTIVLNKSILKAQNVAPVTT